MMFSDTVSCHLLWGQSTGVTIRKEALDVSWFINNTSSSEFLLTLWNDKAGHSVAGSSSAEGQSSLSNVNSVSLSAATHL
jgi:hypothetical protein